MENKEALIKYFRNRFSPNRGNPEEFRPMEPGVAPRGYTRPTQPVLGPSAPPQRIPRGLEPGVAPRGYTRPTQPVLGPSAPPQRIPRGLEPGVAPRGYTRPNQPAPTANPQRPISGEDFQPILGKDHHLDRMWQVLTPEEKQGLFGGLMSGKIKIPNISRSNQVVPPSQTGLDRTGYIPTWYRERFSVVQPSTTEPLIPRVR